MDCLKDLDVSIKRLFTAFETHTFNYNFTFSLRLLVALDLYLLLIVMQTCDGTELCPGEWKQHKRHDERAPLLSGLL